VAGSRPVKVIVIALLVVSIIFGIGLVVLPFIDFGTLKGQGIGERPAYISQPAQGEQIVKVSVMPDLAESGKYCQASTVIA